MNRNHLVLVLSAYLLLSLIFNLPFLHGIMDDDRVFFALGMSKLGIEGRPAIAEVLDWGGMIGNSAMPYLAWSHIGKLLFGAVLTPFQLSALFKISANLIAFAGAFLLASEYLNAGTDPEAGRTWRLAAAFIGGLIYGMNPSYWLGDSGWVGIEFAYAMFPLVVWSFHRSVSKKDFSYCLLCAFLMAVNDGEHMLWGGFHIFLAFYAAFLFLKNSLEEKKASLTPPISFALTFAAFFALISYKYFQKSTSLWQPSLSISTSGLDVTWSNASPLNLLNGVSHMELTMPYSGISSALSFLNSFWDLTLLLPLLAILTIIVCWKKWPVVFYWLLLIGSVLPFFNGSPLKWFHYWIFFNTPFGALFRTWRIPAAYISLSMCILVPFGLYWLIQKLPENARHLRMSVPVVAILLIIIWAWPLFVMGDTGKLTSLVMPPQYSSMLSALSAQAQCPYFIIVPGYNEKPSWSLDWGAPDVLHASLLQEAVGKLGLWAHYYYHSVAGSPFSLLEKGDAVALARSLRLSGVNCFMVNSDIPGREGSSASYVSSLNASGYFDTIYADDLFHVFRLKDPVQDLQVSSEVILVDGGYRAVDELLRDTNDSCPSCGFIFLDQNPPSDAIANADFILTDKDDGQLESVLVFDQVLKQGGNIIYPYMSVLDHDPWNKWSRASYLEPHQSEWHLFLPFQDYSSDFDYFQGLAFIGGSNDSFDMQLTAPEEGDYVLLTRYFESADGRTLVFDAAGSRFEIPTHGDYNGFLWYNRTVHLTKGTNQMTITSPEGFNALSAIAVIPKEQYLEMARQASDYLSNSRVIRSLPAPFSNPSFEGGLEGWDAVEYVGYPGLQLSVDDSTAWDGSSSLRAERETGSAYPSWISIESGWINVSEGETLLARASIKPENVSAYRMVVGAFDPATNSTYFLYGMPFKQELASGWEEYEGTITIPPNVTMVKLLLGIGCFDNASVSCRAWFDDANIIPERKFDAAALSGKKPVPGATILQYEKYRVAAGMYQVRLVANASEPFLLTYNALYHPSMEALVYDSTGEASVKKAVPVYGLLTGFWVNQTGEGLVIDIQEKDSGLLQATYWISTLGFIGTAVFLIYRFGLKRTPGV